MKAFVSWDFQEDPIFDSEGEEVGSEEYVLIEKVFVPSEQRGKGIARKLLMGAIAEAKNAHQKLSIKIAALPFDEESGNALDMVDLVSFYESVGFDVEGDAGSAIVMSM